MQEVDVICIGAINCDYMFHVRKSDKKKANPDDNDEKLNWKDYKAVEKEVTELYRGNHNYSTQIGGSAFLALKTIHAIDLGLRTAYRKINNDTGAGDCFAGGFIAGLLSDRFLSQQPFAIELGVIASETRMTIRADSDIFKEIRKASEHYINRKMKQGTLNTWQRVSMVVAKYKQFVGGLIVGAITTFLAGCIVNVVEFLIVFCMAILKGS